MENPQTESYTLHEVLGEGSCGRVYRCTTPADGVRAVKVLTAMAINRDLVRSSLRKLSELPPHPGLVRIHHHELSDTPYHYVMDLYADRVVSAEGSKGIWQSRQLDSLIGAVDQEEAWRLIEQLAETLAYLHDNDLFHCGLKPSNILLSEEGSGLQTKIGDLGQGWVSGAHYLELGDLPYYACPEQLRTAEFLDGHGKQWDVYSFGVVAYQLLNGRLPRLNDWYREFIGAPATDGAFAAAAGLELGIVEHSPPEFADRIEQEKEISWVVHPRNPVEQKRYKILTRCLEIQAVDRFSDMLEVVEAFRTESLAEEVKSMAEGSAGKRSVIVKGVKAGVRWMGPLATSMAALLMVAGITILVLKWKLDRVDEVVAQAQNDLKEGLALKNVEVAAAAKQMQAAENRAARAVESERSARSQLAMVQQFGDEFFELVRRHQGLESLEFQKDRKRALERARDYYEDFISRNAENPKLLELRVAARQYLVDILKETGSRKQVREALVSATEGIDVLLQDRPADEYWRLEKAVNQRELSLLLLEDARVAEAREVANESLVALNKLAEWRPESARYRLELALSLLAWGKVESGDQELDKAVATLGQAVEMLMPMHESAPEDPHYRYHLAQAFGSLGDVGELRGDLDGAIETHNKAVDFLSPLVLEAPGSEEYTRELSHSLLRLAHMEGSLKKGQDALKLLARLTKTHPGDDHLRHELAESYGLLGELQRDQGQVKNAGELQNESLAILDALILEYPDVEEYRFAHANCLYRQAGLAEDGGSMEQSLGYLTQAWTAVKELAENDRDNIHYQRKLAELRGSIGFANEKAGNKEKAKEVYAAAVHDWERLASLLPEDDVVERGLAWSRRQLAALGR